MYLYNASYFFGFSGKQIAATSFGIMLSPAVAYTIVPRLGRRCGKKHAAIITLVCFIVLYPTPYVLFLIGWWPPVGSWTGLYIFSAFIVTDVILVICVGVMMDSMMADVVEDSQVSTERRSEGLFFAVQGHGVG